MPTERGHRSRTQLHRLHHRPRSGPVLYVYPDETTARENAQDRIIPMLRSSPRLREYLTGMADDMGSLRIKMSHLTIIWRGRAPPRGLATSPFDTW